MHMLRLPPTVLRTSRLELRAARREHAAMLFSGYTGRKDASQFLQRDAHASEDRTKSVIDAYGEGSWTTTNRFGWSIIPHADRKAVGLFYLFVSGNEAEIHYGLGPAFWGRGLATEAGRAVMDWIINDSTLLKVSTICASQNQPSLRVLEKIGLRRVQFLPAALHSKSTGEIMDASSYIWTRDE